MPSSRASTCFVPGCKGGYRSCSEKLSVFKAPKDLSRREQWARNIKRADKELTRDSVVCERHFDASFIERTYRHIINGEVVEIPHDCPRLSEDAVPTLFPDAPKYFTKKAPVKRKDRNICEQRGPAKKRQKPNSVSRQEPEAHVQQQEHEDPNVLPEVETSDAVHADAEVQRVCGNLRLPDETWNKLTRHGGIIFDEMKLAERFNVSAAGTVEGFVDLGKFTQEEDRTTPADHGMLMMFQPFQGDWTQILGVFSSKGNIKAEMLAELLLEAILLSEQAGLFVDFVFCDGATWNRSMWRSFGIGASSVKTTCNVTHPVDPSRKLHFCSDFPHLVKCVRNSFVSTGFTTQDGRACVEDIEAAWEKDKSSLTLKAMPHINESAHSAQFF
ncbi:hypothetical protein HPB51_016411 [Rhipicephalus microplus]|uniref:THAP-type domain-containing protein n=1 Tax=Rhipicephalus microplus TaxID=6941 RepID=A0A9J6EAS9_RHIMP|nr:hypothetical protein HPB51_016411 [Rhipicephalus microplus]